MHYQIFIPTDAPKAPQQLLIDVGLSDHIAGHEPRANSQGPEEKMGTLFAWRKPGANQRFHFNANEQTWIPAVQQGESPGGRYWVGFWNDSPVAPEDLQRSHAEYGDAVTLGDGNEWMIPVAQNFTKDLIRSDDGSWKFEIQRQHQSAWNDSQQWLARLRDDTEFSFSELADFVELFIRLNYRMPTEVVSGLKLFNTKNLVTALSVILSTTIRLNANVE